jgi:hypothetical protein
MNSFEDERRKNVFPLLLFTKLSGNECEEAGNRCKGGNRYFFIIITPSGLLVPTGYLLSRVLSCFFLIPSG